MDMGYTVPRTDRQTGPSTTCVGGNKNYFVLFPYITNDCAELLRCSTKQILFSFKCMNNKKVLLRETPPPHNPEARSQHLLPVGSITPEPEQHNMWGYGVQDSKEVPPFPILTGWGSQHSIVKICESFYLSKTEGHSKNGMM